MPLKSCCVENCLSRADREEDHGVTYHSFPKNKTLRKTWSNVTHFTSTEAEAKFVCSRHFRRTDFQPYKDSKFILKSDAVPSIFPWTVIHSIDNKMDISNEFNDENANTSESHISTKESEVENLDNIKKFIEDQEKAIQDDKNLNKTENKSNNTEMKEATELAVNNNEQEAGTCQTNKIDAKVNPQELKETLAMESSVMDRILIETESNIPQKKELKSIYTEKSSNNSMALSVKSLVEAKDFGNNWHPAEIVEVDYDEMEVLVHYKIDTKRHDEWISVSSPRLRPRGSQQPKSELSTKQIQTSQTLPEPTNSHVRVASTICDSEVKMEDKQKQSFVVGERCLARWRDNRKFIATVTNDLGNGEYEILFDDGFKWKCNTSRLSKMKDTTGKGTDTLYVDTSNASSPSVSSPIPGPSSASPTIAGPPLLAYHTHLFDPARDYLGSKSERRAMKRKLNIKEIFNIGQKKRKVVETPKKTEAVKKVEKPIVTNEPKVVKEPKAVKELQVVKEPKYVKVVKEANGVKEPTVVAKKSVVTKKKTSKAPQEKKEIPAALASIIGTDVKEEPLEAKNEIKSEPKNMETKVEIKEEIKVNEKNESDAKFSVEKDEHTITNMEYNDMTLKPDVDKETEELPREKYIDNDPIDKEAILEKFEKQDSVSHEEVIDKIKEAITKLEDGLNNVEKIDLPQVESKLEIKEEIEEFSEVKVEEIKPQPEATTSTEVNDKKKLLKIKKGKKLRLLQEKKVKKQVEKVTNELEEMKRQVEEMRKQMLLKTAELSSSNGEMPESFLLPGEWCCKWVNNQPLGIVSELEASGKVDANNRPVLPRRCVQVEDKRLPSGWIKHLVRRSFGSSAGKWDVVLVSPDNKKFHTKNEMRHYLENNPTEAANLRPYEHALFDFGIHMKLARRMGWVTHTADGAEAPVTPLPAAILGSTSPLVKKIHLGIKRRHVKLQSTKKRRLPPHRRTAVKISDEDLNDIPNAPMEVPPLEDGYVYVGALKVQVIDNLLRCPAEGCLKNFRNNTLMKMHIKHYHKDLRKMLGATPKVLDLASARTKPNQAELNRIRREAKLKTIKVKLPKLVMRKEKPRTESSETKSELKVVLTPIKPDLDSPALESQKPLIPKPVKRPRVLLPVRRAEPMDELPTQQEIENDPSEMEIDPELLDLDFETAISTHTVTKPIDFGKKKEKKEKRKKTFATVSKKPISEEEDWFVNSDVDTTYSFPRSGTPDSKFMDSKMDLMHQHMSSESNEEHKDINMYTFNEYGERIKIVRMKREEIINCHCGIREEDGLMVQCELCLCWQHALCHNIQKESEVPEKYTCGICLNPRRGRRSQRFLHDQDRLYEGVLVGARASEPLRRAHELSGNLLRVQDTLHALRVKYYVANKKNHPKLYLWAKEWDTDLALTQEKLNSDYSDLNIMINDIDKENLPIRSDDMQIGLRTPSSDMHDDRFRDGPLGPQSLLSGLLSSPGGGSLDLPISTTELERLAKSVQEQEVRMPQPQGPQPEEAIENSACREKLLRHIQCCQALVDARLDSIEAQVAELESQDPSFEDDETADYFPRTKQTVQMLMRDLDTMEELGVIT